MELHWCLQRTGEHTWLHKDWLYLCGEGHLCFAFGPTWDTWSAVSYNNEGLKGSNTLSICTAQTTDNVIPPTHCPSVFISHTTVSFQRVRSWTRSIIQQQAGRLRVKTLSLFCLCRSSITFWKPSTARQGGGGTNCPGDVFFRWQSSHSVVLDQKQRTGVVKYPLTKYPLSNHSPSLSLRRAAQWCSVPAQTGPFCVEFACSPCVCMDSLRVLRLTPAVQRQAS